MHVRLLLNTWREVEAYLARSRLILVPIGSTEQHGPNGLLGTDALVAEAVAVGAAERAGALVAPTISVGMALHHMAFPGSMSLRPETLIAVVRDTAWSLHQHGFRGVLFVNGHGGNIATGAAAFSALREELPELVLEWTNWYQVPAVKELAAGLYGDREGGHATPSEVAVTMALHPDVVRPLEGPLEMASCRPRGIPGSRAFRALYPDGRIGSDPSLATAEHGRQLLERAVAAVADQATRLAAQVAPGG